MSVICGMYRLDGQCVTGIETMMQGFAPYKFDKSQIWQMDNVFFGSRLQIVTPEAEDEQLPYHDTAADLIITADAIIDNRLELFDQFSIPYSRRAGMPDSILILEAYKRWGEECPRYLVGDFAFAIWDRRKKKLFCARDHVGKTILYYYHCSKLFAFATLLKPLMAIPNMVSKLSEAWLADFLANPTVISQVDPELTPYENVYMLLPGHTLTVTVKGKKVREYWRVQTLPELKLGSDAQYEEAFREVFFEAVRCRLRCKRPVGVLLSGGLDSTSIAGVAARYLADKGERIRGFTSIPMTEYRDWTLSHKYPDETPYVEAFCRHAGNVDVVYGRAEGRNVLNTTDKINAILEQPYKYCENAMWIDSLLEAASQQYGIGVMLSGQSGNGTISWGMPEVHLNALLRKGKWLDLWREAAAWGRIKGGSPFMWTFRAVQSLLPLAAYKSWWYLQGREDRASAYSAINPDLAKQSGFPERFYQFGGEPYGLPIPDAFTARAIMNSHNIFNQTANLEKKMSLAYDMVIRDPSRDKRVVEFCLSVPDSQYVRRGQDRFLLRRAMQGIVPDIIRLNNTVRGTQGADWLQRIAPYWQDVECELLQLFARQDMQYYLDVPRLTDILAQLDKADIYSSPNANFKVLIYALIFGRFINNHV